MRFGRILIAAIASTLFVAVVGAATCGWLFNWVYELEPTNIWKPMEGAPRPLVYEGGFVLNLIFAVVYVILSKGIPGKSKAAKGLVFGLCVWAVGVVPGVFSTYAFTNVAGAVVIYWTISELVWTPLRGMIVALTCDGKPAANVEG